MMAAISFIAIGFTANSLMPMAFLLELSGRRQYFLFGLSGFGSIGEHAKGTDKPSLFVEGRNS